MDVQSSPSKANLNYVWLVAHVRDREGEFAVKMLQVQAAEIGIDTFFKCCQTRNPRQNRDEGCEWSHR